MKKKTFKTLTAMADFITKNNKNITVINSGGILKDKIGNYVLIYMQK